MKNSKKPQWLRLINVLFLAVGLIIATSGTVFGQIQQMPDEVTEEFNELHEEMAESFQEGDYNKAIQLTKRMLSIADKWLGITNKNTIILATNLVNLYDSKGDYSEVDTLYKRALETDKKLELSGRYVFELAELYHFLGLVYYKQGNMERATVVYQGSANVMEKTSGLETENGYRTIELLARLYRIIGDYNNAERNYHLALKTRKRMSMDEDLNLARLLNDFSIIYLDRQDYKQAEPLLDQAMKIVEKRADDIYTSTIINNLGSVYQLKGEYEKAEEFYKRGLELRKKFLVTDHPDIAQSLSNIAALYAEQGNYQQAELGYQQAVKILEKTPESQILVATLNNLAGNYRRRGNYDQSEKCYKQALETLKKVLPATHPRITLIMSNIASLYAEQGNYPEAQRTYQQIVDRLTKSLENQDVSFALTLSDFGAVFNAQGNYQQAEQFYQQAYEVLKKSLDKGHVEFAPILNKFGDLYTNKGDYERAKMCYQQALEIFEKSLGKDHPEAATSAISLANLIDDDKEAEKLYQRAIAIYEKAPGIHKSSLAICLNNLANFYGERGKYDESEKYYKRSIDILENLFGMQHPDIATALSGFATLQSSKGNYQQAEDLYKKALAICEKTLSSEHPGSGIILNNMATMYLSKGDISKALEYEERTNDIQEKNLAVTIMSGSEEQKRLYTKTLDGKTYSTVSLHLQFAPKDIQAAKLALTTILRRKGRVLDAVSNSFQQLRNRLSSEDKMLFDELTSVRAQLASVLFTPLNQFEPKQYNLLITNLQQQADKLENTISQRNIVFRNEFQPIALKDIQEAIPIGTALIEIVLYKPFNPKAKTSKERFGEPRYAAYILWKQGDPKWIDLGQVTTIDKDVEKLQTALKSVESVDTDILARAVDEQVMHPIRNLLGSTRKLLISPDGLLGLIPFEALVDENNKYLIEDFSISYLTTGRDLLRLKTSVKSQQNPVIVANPDFSAGGVTNENGNNSLNDRSGKGLLYFSPQPSFIEEANSIAKILPTAKLLVGIEATESALKQLHCPSIVHIASHGFFLPDQNINVANSSFSLSELVNLRSNLQIKNPMLLSGIALAGANVRTSETADGLLTALELSGLDLIGTKLVVLAACKTGVGSASNKEGIYGLRRALVIAGAETQVLSLWEVRGGATRDFMIEYYNKLALGEDRSEALRQVKLNMLLKSKILEKRRPYYWASFVLSGNWKPIDKVDGKVK